VCLCCFLYIKNYAQKDSIIVSPDFRNIVPGKFVIGIASYYSKSLQGSKTATGEIYKHEEMTAASNNFKLNTWVRVTRIKTGVSIIVRINDRMHPAMKKKGRVVDLSRSAAAKLGFIANGLTKVRVEIVEKQVP
jgi:rare lipoprotein A